MAIKGAIASFICSSANAKNTRLVFTKLGVLRNSVKKSIETTPAPCYYHRIFLRDIGAVVSISDPTDNGGYNSEHSLVYVYTLHKVQG